MVRHPTSRTQAEDDVAVDIRALRPDELHSASTVLAHGMCDNPVHVQVFGMEPSQRHRRLSRFLDLLIPYIHSHGEVLGAYVNGEHIGVLGMLEPGACRPAIKDKMHLAGAILASTPPAVVLRIRHWLSAWARNDSSDPHWHIGPLSVNPKYRRRGIGRCLMRDCCNRMDALGATANLETDLATNVTFYESLGFVVTGREVVLGVPNWFMSRPPSSPQ